MISVLVDERISAKMERSLLVKGFSPIKLPRHPALGIAIASHPDSLVFYADGELFTPCEYCDIAPYVFSDIRDTHPNIKLNFTSDTLSEKYPRDCAMNAKLVGKRLFAREKSLSKTILEFASNRGYEIINTSQGYPACVSLVLSEDVVITADTGLAKTYETAGITVTLIRNGGIALPPHEYGFIGGACGVYRDRVYFLGDYKTHRDADIIEKTLKKNGFTPVSLSEEPLIDLGGLIFIE